MGSLDFRKLNHLLDLRGDLIQLGTGRFSVGPHPVAEDPESVCSQPTFKIVIPAPKVNGFQLVGLGISVKLVKERVVKIEALGVVRVGVTKRFPVFARRAFRLAFV